MTDDNLIIDVDDLFYPIDGTPKIYADDFFRWFATWLKDKGLQFSKCGFQDGQRTRGKARNRSDHGLLERAYLFQQQAAAMALSNSDQSRAG